MEQEDYLKRQIDQIGRVLGKILSDLLGLKSCGQVTDGIGISNQILKDELDIDLQVIIDTSPKDLMNVLTSEMNFTNESLEKLADIFLLLEEGGQHGNKDKLLLQSLTIFEYLEHVEKTYSIKRQLNMRQIRNALSNQLSNN